MQQAAQLLPTMHRRYGSDEMGMDELRSGDARAAPDTVREQHHVVDESIAGVHCTWIDPGRRRGGLIVSLHGGGYVVGPGPAHWNWLATLCRDTGSAGLLLRYSRAPEATYPTALGEALGVVATVDTPWSLVGDSAGGGLALALAYALRDAGRALPTCMVLSSPWLDTTMTRFEMLANQHIDPMLGVHALDRYAGWYAGGTDRRNPGLSPVFGDAAGLPPMLITVGGAELFVFETREWKARCDAAGTRCEVIEVAGAIHDFAIALTMFPEARDVLPAQVNFLHYFSAAI